MRYFGSSASALTLPPSPSSTPCLLPSILLTLFPAPWAPGVKLKWQLGHRAARRLAIKSLGGASLIRLPPPPPVHCLAGIWNQTFWCSQIPLPPSPLLTSIHPRTPSPTPLFPALQTPGIGLSGAVCCLRGGAGDIG